LLELRKNKWQCLICRDVAYRDRTVQEQMDIPLVLVGDRWFHKTTQRVLAWCSWCLPPDPATACLLLSVFRFLRKKQFKEQAKTKAAVRDEVEREARQHGRGSGPDSILAAT